MDARKDLNKKMLKETQTNLIQKLAVTDDLEETSKILACLTDIRKELEQFDRSGNVRWDLVIPAATSIVGTLLVLRYEESSVITSKAWSKIRW